MSTKLYLKNNLDLIFLSIYFFSLPIAHFAAVQSISSALFILTFLIQNHSKIELNLILKYKNVIYVFLIFILLALISLFYTPDIQESIKEIGRELIRNFFVLFLFVYYIYLSDDKKIKNIFIIIASILLIHTLLNIGVWIYNGGWPARTGAFLDGTIKGIRSGAGERFGIWATYMLSISLAMIFQKYKKIGYLFLFFSILSIMANQTRATFISTILIFIITFFTFFKSKKIKLTILLLIFLAGSLFYQYSSKLSPRYDVKHIVLNLKKVINTPPSKFQNLGIEYSTYTRLAMWKSVILYRLKDPFIPQEYGRFLYGKSIKSNFKNQPENLPLHIYAQTHNDFIGMLYSLGLIGLVIFIYFLYYQLKISYILSKIKTNSLYRIFGIFIFLGTIGFIGSMMFGSFFGDSEAKFFYPLYGMVLGLYLKVKRYIQNGNSSPISQS